MNSDIPRDLAYRTCSQQSVIHIGAIDLWWDDMKMDAPATGILCQDDKPFIL